MKASFIKNKKVILGLTLTAALLALIGAGLAFRRSISADRLVGSTIGKKISPSLSSLNQLPFINQMSPDSTPSTTSTQSVNPAHNSQPKTESKVKRTSITGDVDTTEDVRGLGYTDARKMVKTKNGQLFVAYRKKDQSATGKPYGIFVATSTDGGKNWQITNGGKTISNGTNDYDQRVPSIAVDGQDRLHVTWYGRDINNAGKNQREIKYSRSSDLGKTWSDWQNIALIPGYAEQDLWQEHPAITVGADNKIYIVWEGKDVENNDNQQVKLIRSDTGGNTWTPPRNIYRIPQHTQSRPSLVERADGSLVIVAYTSYKMSGGVQQIQISTSSDKGTTWSDWRNVSQTDQDARHVTMVEDSEKVLHFAWRQMTDGRAQIFTANLNGNTLSKATAVSRSDTSQFFPSLSALDKGVAIGFTETNSFSGLPREEVYLPATSLLFVKSGQENWRQLKTFDGGSIVLMNKNSSLIGGVYLSAKGSAYGLRSFSEPY